MRISDWSSDVCSSDLGEIPYRMDEIDEALGRADLFVSIGTSGAVYPAAGFVQTARYVGARTLEMNLEPSQASPFFDESRMGRAGVLVPAWVGELLRERKGKRMKSRQ